jgi:hypothetical protein
VESQPGEERAVAVGGHADRGVHRAVAGVTADTLDDFEKDAGTEDGVWKCMNSPCSSWSYMIEYSRNAAMSAFGSVKRASTSSWQFAGTSVVDREQARSRPRRVPGGGGVVEPTFARVGAAEEHRGAVRGGDGGEVRFAGLLVNRAHRPMSDGAGFGGSGAISAVAFGW